MKMITVACSAAVVLTSCHAATARGATILSNLDRKEDNELISDIEAQNPGSLCSVVGSDGHALLMSFGQQAVVDVDGKPLVLSYRPSRGHQASFTGAGIRVSGDLERQDVTDFGKTLSRDVTVKVQANGRAERVPAQWTCQKSLMTVKVRYSQ